MEGIDSRISLYKLEIFNAVVEFGGVTAAADHLLVSQPVVTAHIRSLEQRIGAPLFRREGRQLRLTEAGEAVQVWSAEVLTRMKELSRHIEGLSDGKRGAAVLGASMSVGSYILPPVLSRFQRERPLVELSLYISESDHVIQATELGECDFSVVIVDHEFDSPTLTKELLRQEEFIIVGAPDAGLPEGEIDVDELGLLPFIEAPRGMIRRSLIDRQLERVGIHRRNVVIELGHPEAMKRAAQQGLGVTMLFRSSIEEDIALGRLREIKLRDTTLAVPLCLAYRKEKRFSPVQRELIDAIRNDVAGDRVTQA